MELFTFSGRARRRTYFLHHLIDGFVLVALLFLVLLLVGAAIPENATDPQVGLGVGIAMLACGLLMALGLVSALAVTVRRLHDLGHSGWGAVGMFIPVVNLVMWIYLVLVQGESGKNGYGKDPRRA